MVKSITTARVAVCFVAIAVIIATSLALRQCGTVEELPRVDAKIDWGELTIPDVFAPVPTDTPIFERVYDRVHAFLRPGSQGEHSFAVRSSHDEDYNLVGTDGVIVILHKRKNRVMVGMRDKVVSDDMLDGPKRHRPPDDEQAKVFEAVARRILRELGLDEQRFIPVEAGAVLCGEKGDKILINGLLAALYDGIPYLGDCIKLEVDITTPDKPRIMLLVGYPGGELPEDRTIRVAPRSGMDTAVAAVKKSMRKGSLSDEIMVENGQVLSCKYEGLTYVRPQDIWRLGKKAEKRNADRTYLTHVYSITLTFPVKTYNEKVTVWVDVRSGKALGCEERSGHGSGRFTEVLSRIMKERLGFKQFEVRYDVAPQPAE